MWLKFLPWKFFVRRMARSQGFLDPFNYLSHLRRFAQPSEVSEPIELLRAGAAFHARGLLNSRVIQHNLDWVWPYWVERQFDPEDDAFVPRAFSLTHINLTHRNWTAVGLPNHPATPIVDPHGLVTPFFDGWSIDGWLITENGIELLPSRLPSVHQQLDFASGLAVATQSRIRDLSLDSRAEVEMLPDGPACKISFRGFSHSPGWIVVALRPYNPEGVSLVFEVSLDQNRSAWTIEDDARVEFSAPCEAHAFSTFNRGDVFVGLHDHKNIREQKVECDLGMATAAALFELKPNEAREISVSIPLIHDHHRIHGSHGSHTTHGTHSTASWEQAISGHSLVKVGEEKIQFLYDAAIRTLILHSSEDVYPGPYTYKRFWFRDAAFILNGLLCAGFIERAEPILDRFPSRQTPFGYFHSQDGEWDSNGEALWIMNRFCELSGKSPKPEWESSITSGAKWIARKRLGGDSGSAHAGLLPAGFSAEHLGLNDYYYWDDFWGVAGLHSAAQMLRSMGRAPAAEEFETEAADFTRAIDRSLEIAAERLGERILPAAPYRRMDCGAVGSLAIGYPLQLCSPDDPRLLATAKFLMEKNLVHGGFFQDMIHSGVNAYLTLHLAQVLLRSGDPRYYDLMKTVARLASPTGQWPEAIHPRTLGGCMGDGQHVWAAAEWILMVRNCFVREERRDRLILCSGISEDWFGAGNEISFGPAPTTFGAISISVVRAEERLTISWQAAWRGAPPQLEVHVPGHEQQIAAPGQTTFSLERASAS